MDAAPDIEAALVAWVTEQCGATRVELRWLGVDPARLAPGGRPGFDGDPCRAHPTLTLSWAVGDDPDQLRIRPDLDVWVPAPVAARSVPAGGRVEIVPGEARIADLASGVWAGGDAVAVRALQAGAPVTRDGVRAVPDAVTGAAVVLRITAGALQIEADGRLMHDAAVGDEVRAYVKATDAVVRGVLVAPDAVAL